MIAVTLEYNSKEIETPLKSKTFALTTLTEFKEKVAQ